MVNSSFVEIGDASIYYESRGSGYPLILISGFTCDHTLWKPVIKFLEPYFQVIRFDNRGVGRTKDSGKKLSCELLAEDLRGLMHALNLKRPHIIGQSMGGTIAQTFAMQYPDEVGKLGLLVTSAKWRQATVLAMRAHLNFRKHQTDPSILIDSILPWIYGEKFLSDKNNLATAKKFALENAYPQSIYDQERQFALLENFDGRKDLQRIKAKTLIMYGKEDLLALPADAEFLHSHIPGSEIMPFDAAHGVILEEAEKLSSAIIRFFT